MANTVEYWKGIIRGCYDKNWSHAAAKENIAQIIKNSESGKITIKEPRLTAYREVLFEDYELGMPPPPVVTGTFTDAAWDKQLTDLLSDKTPVYVSDVPSPMPATAVPKKQLDDDIPF